MTVKLNENFEFPVLRFVIFYVVLSVIALFVVYIYMLIMIFYVADVPEFMFMMLLISSQNPMQSRTQH